MPTPRAAGTTSATGSARDWWGAGPGAHSHVGGVRWWNVKHPARYANLLAEGRSPAAGRELLTVDDRRVERVMLELRLSDGLPASVLSGAAYAEAAVAVSDGSAGRGARSPAAVAY